MLKHIKKSALISSSEYNSIAVAAVKQNAWAIQYVTNPTLELYKLAYNHLRSDVLQFVDFKKFNIDDIIEKTEIRYIDIDVVNKIVYKDVILGKYKYINKADTMFNTIIKHIKTENEDPEVYDGLLIVSDENKDINFLIMNSDSDASTNKKSFYVVKNGDTYELYKKENELVDVGIFISSMVPIPKIIKLGEYFDPCL